MAGPDGVTFFTSIAIEDVFLANSDAGTTTFGTAGQVLVSNGSSAAATWQTLGTATIPLASTATEGIVSNAAQSFSGAKTFVDAVTIEPDDNASAFIVNNGAGDEVFRVDTTDESVEFQNNLNGGNTDIELDSFTTGGTERSGILRFNADDNKISLVNGGAAGLSVDQNQAVTIGVVGGTSDHVANGNSFKFQRASSGNNTIDFRCQPTSGVGNTLVNIISDRDAGTGQTLQVRFQYGPDGSERQLARFLVANTDATASSSGGILDIQTTQTDGTRTTAIQIDETQNVIMPTLPTSDPSISGALYNSSGTIMISSG